MHRALVIAALVACVLFEFYVYPGHSYLEGESQLFAAMIERLQFPGFLSRDLVGTHPVLRYTAIDEATLAIARLTRAGLAGAFLLQLLLARLAATSGAYLLFTSLGVKRVGAVAAAAISGLGVYLPALEVSTADREPVPYALALGWIVLSTGLVVKGRVMAAGVAGGVALLYSPAIALPWWLCLAFTVCWRKPLRPALRTVITTFATAALLLANLAQLQPGAPGGNSLFCVVPDSWQSLLLQRTPGVLVASWIGHEGWLFSAVIAASLLALFRLRGKLTHGGTVPSRNSVFGWFSIAFAWAAQRTLPWALWLHLEPTRSLAVATAVALIALLAAAFFSARERRWREGFMWAVAVMALLATTLFPANLKATEQYSPASLQSLATWAEHNTWGASLFSFSGIGRHSDPGRFRVLAMRSVFIDWQSGSLTQYFRDFGEDWRWRWNKAHKPPDAAPKVAHKQSATAEALSLLDQPIDYFVLPATERPGDAKPVFTADDLAVYDAGELRTASRRLRDRKLTQSN